MQESTGTSTQPDRVATGRTEREETSAKGMLWCGEQGNAGRGRKRSVPLELLQNRAARQRQAGCPLWSPTGVRVWGGGREAVHDELGVRRAECQEMTGRSKDSCADQGAHAGRRRVVRMTGPAGQGRLRKRSRGLRTLCTTKPATFLRRFHSSI